MAIDWSRFTFLATDGSKSIWTYPTMHVVRDTGRLRLALPRYPRHDFVPAMRGIVVIFNEFSLENITATIDNIAGRIAVEGMGNPGRKRGESDDTAI